MLMPLGYQVVWLFVLALPIACVAWTVTHEEVFRELRDFCEARSRACRSVTGRKAYYLFTCEYCFSHYVTIVFMAITNYKLLSPGFGGYVIAFFALVWVANAYMSLFGRLRVDIRAERAEADTRQKEAVKVEKETRRIETETRKLANDLDAPGEERRGEKWGA
jgi:hypothetical protein